MVWLVQPPCGRRHGYQEALDTLVDASRVDDACWLLTQFGPTNAVLTVDALEAEAIVFAGTVEVRGGIDVDDGHPAGRSIPRGRGCVRAAMVAGEDIRAAASSAGRAADGGMMRADWGCRWRRHHCGGDLRARCGMVCNGRLHPRGGPLSGRI